MAESILAAAIADGKPALALQALRELRENLALTAKLTHVEESLAPETYLPRWQEIKTKLLRVAEDHPGVREAMLAALIEDHSKDE